MKCLVVGQEINALLFKMGSYNSITDKKVKDKHGWDENIHQWIRIGEAK